MSIPRDYVILRNDTKEYNIFDIDINCQNYLKKFSKSNVSLISLYAIHWIPRRCLENIRFFSDVPVPKDIHHSIECLVVCHLSVFGIGTSEKKGMFSKQRRGH